MAGQRPLTVVHYMASVHLVHGGVDRTMLAICQHLAQHGQRVVLMTRDPTDVPTEWSAGAEPNLSVVTLTRTGGPRRRLLASDRRRTLDVLRDADALHLHVPWERTNLEMAALARSCNTPYVLSPHGMLDDWPMRHHNLRKRLYLLLGGRRMLNRAAAIHCTAEAELRQAQRWYANDRGFVLPCLFDTAAFLSPPGPDAAREAFACLRSDRPRLLFLSRVHPKKGVEHLIDAVAQLNQRHVHPVTIIAGPAEPDYLRALQRRVARHGLDEDVHFVGMVSGDLKLSLYQACDLFVLPTHQENFGLVLPEAMLCHTPVVTTKGVDIWAELERGGAVIIPAPADDPGPLTDAIAGLLADPDDLRRRARQGRSFVLDWLDPDKVTQSYIAMYRDLAHGPHV